MSTELDVLDIKRDGGTQVRDGLNLATVQEYADHFQDAAHWWPFPAITVFHDGRDYWLADGFHRLAAVERLGRATVLADVQPGTRRDAVLYAAGANADHGLRRSPTDKRRAVLMLLNDDEWRQWSDRDIARRCNVSNTFVSNLRKSVTVNVDSDRTYVTKHGTVATMDTRKIGSNGSQEPEPEPEPEMEGGIWWPLSLDDENDDGDGTAVPTRAVAKPTPERFVQPPGSNPSADIEQKIMTWYIGRKLNDIRGQLSLMQEIKQQMDKHVSWHSMIAILPAGWTHDNLITAIANLVDYLQYRVDELDEFETAFPTLAIPAPTPPTPDDDYEMDGIIAIERDPEPEPTHIKTYVSANQALKESYHEVVGVITAVRKIRAAVARMQYPAADADAFRTMAQMEKEPDSAAIWMAISEMIIAMINDPNPPRIIQ